MSSILDLLNMKKKPAVVLKWFKPSQAPNTKEDGTTLRVEALSVHPPVEHVLGVCEGSVLVLMSESLFSMKKSFNKWVCV